MIEAFCEQVRPFGARRCDLDAIEYRGAAIHVVSRPTGHIGCSFDVGPAARNTLLEALARNPERGWSNVLLPSGVLARRMVLSPREWLAPLCLHARIEELCGGRADPSRAAERLRVVTLWNGSCCEPDEACAISAAAFLLRRDASAWDGTRHLTDSSAPAAVWTASVAGPSLVRWRSRSRQESGVLRSLRQTPDAARRLLLAMHVSPSDT